MSEGINTSLEKLSKKAGTSKYSADINSTFKTESVMGKQLTDFNTRITTFKRRMADMETSLYKQFTAMETAINKYNSQSSSLSSYFS
ncbi:flagellar capping protein [compost metagenome]